MGFISLPDPISIFESAKTSGLERQEINALASSYYSALITGMWRSGSSKWAQFIGEGQALQDAATAMYLSLSQLETKNFLTLTVPKDLLDAANTERFQTEAQEKKK